MKPRKGPDNSASRSWEAGNAALRLTLGGILAVHGYNKVRGGGGIDGTARWFEALGLKPGRLHAWLAATTEIVSGVGIATGAAYPLPPAGALGLMAVAARTDHKGKGFFVFKGGNEYAVTLAALAAISALIGSGKWSLDRLFGRRSDGLGPLVLAAVLGGGAAAVLLKSSYHPEPETASE